MKQWMVETGDVNETQAVGRWLGAVLSCGDVVALVGPLGAGKTTLVKGVAEGAGVADGRQVNSPTFVIVNEYEAHRREGRLTIHHIDAYRLRDADDLEALGFDEMCAQGAAVLEWADRVEKTLPADRLAIVIEPTGPESRRFTCTATGPRSERLLAAMTGAVDRS